MRPNSRNSIIPAIGVVLILIPLLYKRLYLKNMNMQSLSFFFGFIVVIFFCFTLPADRKKQEQKEELTAPFIHAPAT